MAKKISKITIREQRTKTDSSYLTAYIDEKKNLILEGYDIGKTPKEFWGDSDYEYWLTIKEEYKDSVLLWLIKERFKTTSDFKSWLEQRDIPSDFFSWV